MDQWVHLRLDNKNKSRSYIESFLLSQGKE